ncbi:MAG: hypothetical protein ABL996_22730, partial [Micropepsaceae bacterium]
PSAAPPAPPAPPASGPDEHTQFRATPPPQIGPKPVPPETLPVAEPDGLRQSVAKYFEQRQGEVARLVRFHGLRTVPASSRAFEKY